MRVALLSDYLTTPLTGVGRYAYELSQRLVLNPEFEEISFVSYRGLETWSGIEQRLTAPHSSEGALAKLSNRLLDTALGSAMFEQTQRFQQYRLYQSRGGIELIHAPSIQSLFASPRARSARVMTVHDLSFMVDRSWHPRHRAERMIRTVAHMDRIDLVLAVSAHTKQLLISLLGIDADRVVVVHNGIDSFRSRIQQPTVATSSRRCSLCVSTIEPRKNIDTLLSAYASLPAALRDEFPLHLVGSSGWRSEQTHQRIRKYVAEGWLHYRGCIDDSGLAAAYSSAKLFVYPSFHEGFGLPVLEAMQAGCVVIAGNHSAISEVSGGEAVLLDDIGDVDELREKISAALLASWNTTGESARRVHAAKFTWDTTA